MRITTRGRTCLLFAAVVALGVVGCSGADNPKIADAPAYQPPEFTPPPPTMKGADGQSYQYGSNPEYEDAMKKMNESLGGGR